MKNILILFSFLLVFTSCGNQGKQTQNRNSSHTSQVMQLSDEEKSLKDKLIQIGVLDQRTLIKHLMSFNVMNKDTILKLDQYINVDCIQSTGKCQISPKE